MVFRFQNKLRSHCAERSADQTVETDACEREDHAIDDIGNKHHAEFLDLREVEHHGDAQHKRTYKWDHHVDDWNESHCCRNQ